VAVRRCFEEMGLDGEVAACGGGLQSEAWAAIFADGLGRPILLPDDAAFGAGGAAMIAWAALGRPVDEELWRSQRPGLDPEAGRTAFYEEGFTRYRQQLYSARAVEIGEQWK
jgi:erythritol kinase